MYLVHGALIEAEIMTSPSAYVFAQLGLVLGTGTQPMCQVCQHLTSDLVMFLCNLGTSKKLWCMGP